ncbi:uncharacterized protein LOC144664191 [Oculina patagonica]
MGENVISLGCLLHVIVFILPHAEGAISFTKEPDNPSYVTKGNNVTLVWDYAVTDRKAELKAITWGVYISNMFKLLIAELKNGDRVVKSDMPPAYTERVDIEGRASLVIENITDQDNTFFQCTLRAEPTSGLQIRTSTVKLIVRELPVISPPSINGSYIEGSSVNISCAATGKPDPEVSWMRNGQIKSSGKKIAYLNFDRIKRTDDGLYTCRANNLAGTKTHKEILVVRYPAKILSVTSSAANSWIGQTVTLKCVSDGVPTPTLTWYKPDGNEINTVTAKESILQVTLDDEQDFGQYKCVAYNGLDPFNNVSILLRQIKKPGSPAIISSASDIQATSLTVKWTAPADDGGSPITAYRVVILKGDTEIKNKNVTYPGTTSLSVGSLERDTEYSVKVFARNDVFESTAAQRTIRTKIEGIPDTPEIINMPAEVQSDDVALKWTNPVSNGADITQYTVYIRNVSSNGTVGDWRTLQVIYDVSVREYVITLKKGQRYEFVVTATNKYGESFKEKKNIKRILVLGGSTKSTTNQNETVVRCDREVEILHVVYLSIIIFLVIIIVIISVISWRRRQIPAFLGTMYSFHSNTLGAKGFSGVASSHCIVGLRPERRHICYRKAHSLLYLYTRFCFSAVPKRAKRCSKSLSRTDQTDSIQMTTVVQQKADAQSIETNEVTSTTYEIPNSSDYMPLHPSTRSWEIRREQVNIIKNIGKGAFSQVAKATAKNFHNNQDVTVAVKMLKENAPDSDRKDLLSELELIKKLKPHPHVIKLLGCVTETDPLLVLIEYVPYGDLLGYLRKSRGLNYTYFNNPDRKPKTNLTSQQLMRFAWQIADGMTYLSSRKVIHRDLAARNVLVGEGEKCKVTDFGMARNVHQDDIYTKQSRGRLPVKWTAYEALLYGTYTTQSDVWSYGVLLYEILTIGGSPYPGINARQIAMKLQEGFRMPKPKHVDSKIYQTMLNCWEQNPSDRPTFPKLKETMKDIERNHKTYINLGEYDDSLYANMEDLTAE